jgi:hypothetical protein
MSDEKTGVSDEKTGVSDESIDVIHLLIIFKSTLSDTLVSVMHQRCQNIGVSDEKPGVSDESTDVIQFAHKIQKHIIMS